MNLRIWVSLQFLTLAACWTTTWSATQTAQGQQQPPDKKEFGKKDFPFGPGPFGGPFGQERKLVKQFDRDSDGRLNRTERQTAREFLKKQGRPGGFGPGGKGKGPGGFGPGFGPGSFIAKPLLEALDIDRDGKLTSDEAVAGIKKFIADADKNQRGTLDAAQLAEAFARLLPPPLVFPGGSSPFGFPKDGKPKDAGPKANGPGGERPKADPAKGKGPNDAAAKDGPPGAFVRFGPSTPLANGVLKRADANQDGKVTLAELLTAADGVFKEADKNKDAKLDETELAAVVGQLMPAPMFPGPGGFGKALEPAKPGPRVTSADVKSYPDAPLYEPTVLRTLFLEFENGDWEAELADFHGTDVEVPATLVVDGKKYPNTGVHFRGMSSYMMTPAGYKRSLNLSLDFVDPKQRLYGYRTLNLLNANGDPSLLSSVLYSHIARQHIPAPRANLVKVVINGESWGVYTNVQQFNKEFVAENFKGVQSERWKVRGSPGAGGGLDYLGENIDNYKRRYQIKSQDNEKSWKALIELCRTLDKTPVDQLEAALQPIFDIDGALKFLALDVVLSNSDGYWIRASDYSIVRDHKGVFHLVPHDMNEAFQPAMGFGPGFGRGFGPGMGKGPKGFPGGPGGEKPPEKKPPAQGGKGFAPSPGGFGPDPLVGLDDAKKPLRSRLLAVPSLRKRYLEYVRVIAQDGLDWKKLGPLVAQYRALIAKEVETDTRKSIPFALFQMAVADEPAKGVPMAGPRSGLSLRAFADGRRNFLLNHAALKSAAKETTP